MRFLHALLPLAALTAALAQPPAGPPPPLDNIKAYLGLSDATVASIQQALDKNRANVQPLMQQLGDKQAALGDLLTKGTTDAVAVGKLVLDAEAIRKQIKAQNDALKSTAVSYLTAAQKTKLATLEDAAKLQPTLHEAGALHLIDPPAGAAGGPGGPGPRGFGGPMPQGGPGAPGGPMPQNFMRRR